MTQDAWTNGLLTLLARAAVPPDEDLCVLGEVADPELVGLLPVRRVIEIGDEGPDLRVGEAVVVRILGEVTSKQVLRHDI